jgi:hypothetical protein
VAELSEENLFGNAVLGPLKLLFLLALCAPVRGDAVHFLGGIKKHVILASTVADNGDLNPYAIVVAPVSAGKITQGDVLVNNFNAFTNFQGTGRTILKYSPGARTLSPFARVPASLPQCPDGVGLTTAMAMLKSGWILVGSAPSTRGTTATKGAGAMLVLDPDGNVVDVWTGPEIDAPWGNIALVDQGDRATLFVTMAGAGLGSPLITDPQTGLPPVLHNGTVLRLELRIPPGKPPVLVRRTVVGSGFPQRADLAKFLLGPAGLALGPEQTLFVSSPVDSSITAIADALTRSDSAGTGRVVTQGGLLNRPLAMAMTASGHLLVCNGWNGMVVEVDPGSGQQLGFQWLDSNQAQTPPGNGDLFGIAMTPDQEGFYYVQDDTNLLLLAGK